MLKSAKGNVFPLNRFVRLITASPSGSPAARTPFLIHLPEPMKCAKTIAWTRQQKIAAKSPESRWTCGSTAPPRRKPRTNAVTRNSEVPGGETDVDATHGESVATRPQAAKGRPRRLIRSGAPAMIERRLGPLRLVEELGRGGMGTVYRAVVEDPVGGLPAGAAVAVKVLHPHLAAEADYAERFAREGEIGLLVDDARVVRTHATGRAREPDGPEVPYLVLELVAGQTLRALLGELARLPEALVRHVGREVARGLAAIHRAGRRPSGRQARERADDARSTASS